MTAPTATAATTLSAALSATDPDLLYSDVEDHLRSSVRALLSDRAAPEGTLARAESAEPVHMKLWHTLAADLGCAGLAVPEELGGHGGTARELAVVMEELGASVAPVPFLGSALLATQALLACDVSSAAVSELLGRLAGGVATGALAVPLSTAPGSAFPATVQATTGGTLTG